MTLAPVGSPFFQYSPSFGLAPQHAGDVLVVEVHALSATQYATSLSSSNVTWSVWVSPTYLSEEGTYSTVFKGVVTTAANAGVTVSFNSGTPGLYVGGMEFSTTAGAANVALDTSGTVNSATPDYPSLTPGHGPGELYFCYAINNSVASTGSTSGYSYFLDGYSNGLCYDASCTSGAQMPVWGDSNPKSGIAVLLYETSTSATPGDTAGATDSLALSAAVPLADKAGATDSLLAARLIAQADKAGAVDALAVSPAAAPGDAAAATDALTAVVTGAAASDAAAATDSLAVFTDGAPSFAGTLPATVASYVLPAGYQGGPSGAAAVAPSSTGNGWELYAYAGTDYTTMLAVIPQSMLLSFQFARQLDDIGSGTVVLSQDDPWWKQVLLPGGLAAEALLDEECLWQFRHNGVPRFEFLGETITEQLVDPSEQRQVTITGPGTIAVLKWAMVVPQGFPDITLKLDGILDSFDEVDANGNGVIDTNIWTTLSPAADIYITPTAVLYSYPGGTGYAISTLYPSGSLTIGASAGTTFLGASPYDATNTLISAQVTPIGVAAASTDSYTPAAYGTGLNGSQLTQFYIQSNYSNDDYALFGLSASAFYVQLGTLGSSPVTKILPAYNSTSHAYWMITEQGGGPGRAGTFYFWTSPDGEAWTLQWSYVHKWDATDVSFYVTAQYSVAGQSAQLTNLNSNVTTPSYQGQIYLGVPLMGVWLDQFGQAQRRGTIPFVTSGVTAGGDSYGRAWSDTQNVQATNGTDLYSLLQSGTAVVNADFVMDPGFQLRVGQPAAGEVALGVDRSGYLILREGYDCQTKGRVRARNTIATLIGGENADGHEISATSGTYVTQWGQREAWFQAAVQIDPTSMEYATAASLAQNETEVLSWTLTVTPGIAGKVPFTNYDVGDWLGLERPDFTAVDDIRVTGIAVSVDSTGAEAYELTLVSYIQWLAEQLQYLSNKLGGTFVNSLGTSPVAPSKYGTGQVPTYFTPAATLAGLGDVSGAGSVMSAAPLVYNPATGGYQPAGTTDPVSGAALPVTVAVPGSSATVTATTVTVTTGAGSSTVGLQGDGTVTTVDSGAAAPAVPDTPAVTASVQGLTIAWDGLLAGAAPLANFSCTEFHVSTVSGFTPSAATLVSTAVKAASVSITGMTPGTLYYARLVAVNSSGALSAPSVQASATAALLPASQISGQLPASLLGNSPGALNPNPFFAGGSTAGWAVVNGTLTATPSPPAGAPGAPAYCADVTSTSANCLITGSPVPFPVTAGQPYAMTAWVYNPGGSAVTVATGFNWSGGTTTVSVGPGAWTAVVTVQTAPPGTTSGYQVIGPTGSGVTVYVSGAVAAGQVPGALLAAGSVAANQIAAGTITATQIAAGTITAAQIAANTITVSQLQAAIVIAGAVNGTVITGATFVADGTAGEFLAYSGTPATGNLIMSFAAAAGNDVAIAGGAGNNYPAGFWVYGNNGSAVGMIPSGNNTALALAPGVTPSSSPGVSLMYGTVTGTVQQVDGADAQTYGTARRTLVTASGQTISSTSFTSGTWISTQMAAAAGGAGRRYRVHGKAIFAAASGGPMFAAQWTGPAGFGGVLFLTWTQCTASGSTAPSWCVGPSSNGGATQPGLTPAGGTDYPCEIDGVISVAAGSSGSFSLQCCLGSGSTLGATYVIAANSFIDVMPV